MSDPLSRRERQVMDLIYRQPKATVASIRAAMDDAPSYSAVRALLSTMVDKGLLRTEADGRRYLYFPIVPAEQARVPALQRVVHSFFGGSAGRAALALLAMEEPLSDDEIAALEQAIAQSKESGR